MSRVANNPVVLPDGVEVKLGDQILDVKGAKGSLSLQLHSDVEVKQEDRKLKFFSKSSAKIARAMSGTTRANVYNMVYGVMHGFEKKLELVGVGYRAKVNGSVVNLTLGFSHPVDYQLPEGIKAETPSQTQIIISGIDKQKVGQVAAEIRAFRPPEPYKGKGVKYADERIYRKEAKKK